MKYDEKPDYEKCRKDFQNALKALGKANSGDLEFKATSGTTAKTVSPSAKENLKPARRSLKSPSRPDLSDITEQTENDVHEISPKQKPSTSRPRKRVQTDDDADSDNDEISSKKMRGKNSKTKSTKSSKPSTSDSPSIIINNEVGGTNGKGKTYELNFELDISFDANIVVNVKRKPKKNDEKKEKKSSARPKPNKLSIQSTDEIPGTEQNFHVGTARVKKAPTRNSPRSLK